MNESLMSINERYNAILDKIDGIRANIHLIHAEELEHVMKELEKLDMILKQLEDLYPEEVSGRPI
jgi:archaellum component FlaC